MLAVCKDLVVVKVLEDIACYDVLIDLAAANAIKGDGPVVADFVLLYFLSIFTGSLIHKHYTRECEFGNYDKIKNKKNKKKQHNTKTQNLLAEFLFK